MADDFGKGLGMGMRAAEMYQRKASAEEDRKMRKLMAKEQREFTTGRDKALAGVRAGERLLDRKHTESENTKDRNIKRQSQGMAAARWALDNQYRIAKDNGDDQRMRDLAKQQGELQEKLAKLSSGTQLTAASMRQVTALAGLAEEMRNNKAMHQMRADLQPFQIAAMQAQTAATTAALNPQQTWQKNAGDGVRKSSADLRAARQGFMAAKMNPLSTPEQLAQAEENEKLAAGAYKQAVQHAQRGFEATRPKVQYGTKSVYNPDTASFEDRPFTNYTGSPEDEERWRQLRMPRTSPPAPYAQTGGTGYTPLPPALPVIPDPDKPDSQGLFGR